MRQVLQSFDAESFTACVTDPPYHLTSMSRPRPDLAGKDNQFARRQAQLPSAGFMGKGWDGGDVALRPETWAEVLRVLKPGAHLLAFGGTRTYHRICCAIEDAGFEIRDCIMWVYGSGFPKSLNVSKEMDKRRFGSGQAAEFKLALSEAVRSSGKTRNQINEECGFTMRFDVPYEKDPGCWGSSLPSAEQYDVIVRVLGMSSIGEAAIETLRNWPRTRLEKLYQVIGYEERSNPPSGIVGVGRETTTIQREITAPGTTEAKLWEGYGTALKPSYEPIIIARKPLDGTVANNCLTHGCGALNIDECRVPTGEASLVRPSVRRDDNQVYGSGLGMGTQVEPKGRWPANLIHDGSEEVLAGFPDAPGQMAASIEDGADQDNQVYGAMKRGGPHHEPRLELSKSAARFFYCAKASKSDRGDGNTHPTVKPQELMNFLVRLVKMPERNLILDPFAGSGSTLLACYNEFVEAVGIDLELDHLEIMERRAKNEVEKTPLLNNIESRPTGPVQREFTL